MNYRLFQVFLFGFSILFSLISCTSGPEISVSEDIFTLEFSGDLAFSNQEQFVAQFPNRHSGTENNRKAADWIKKRWEKWGLETNQQVWVEVNYNDQVALVNTMGRIQGESDLEIVLVAHHDQSPNTVEGADNDASGVAILMELAKVFSKHKPKHSLVFVSSDGEEYGMLGSRYFIENHPDPDKILAAISLDNLGKYFYDGLYMDARGQFSGYGDLWLMRLAQETSKKYKELPEPVMDGPIMQLMNQALPVSFMDEGPFVSRGIPSFGFAGTVPSEFQELHWDTYHTPEDLMKHQDPKVLQRAGRMTEALILELFSLEERKASDGGYLYFSGSNKKLGGYFLWLINLGFILLIFYLAWKILDVEELDWDLLSMEFGMYLSFWIPITLSLILLYILVDVGLMDKYALYPATNKDPLLTQPKWLAVGIWVISTAGMLWVTTWLRQRSNRKAKRSFVVRKSITFASIGFSAIYFLMVNPFSMIFLVPLLVWGFIRESHSFVKRFAIFLSGWILIFGLLYYFGFVVLQIDFYVFWYVLIMFSIGMVPFMTSLFIIALLSTGLMLLPRK